MAASDGPGGEHGLTQADQAYLVHRAAVDATVRAASRFADDAIASFDATTQRGYWLMPLTAAVLLSLSGVRSGRMRRPV